jgi:hypothetical protein
MNGDFTWGGALDTHWLVSPRTGVVAVLLCQISWFANPLQKHTDDDFRDLLFAAVTTLDSPAAAPARGAGR